MIHQVPGGCDVGLAQSQFRSGFGPELPFFKKKNYFYWNINFFTKK